MSRQSLMRIIILGRGRDTSMSDSDEMCYATIYIGN
jgi:hypothetical protein